jgi:hypothetical protein
MQCLIERPACVTINISYFVMLLRHAFAHIDHLQRGYSQSNTFIIRVGQDVHIYIYMHTYIFAYTDSSWTAYMYIFWTAFIF